MLQPRVAWPSCHAAGESEARHELFLARVPTGRSRGEAARGGRCRGPRSQWVFARFDDRLVEFGYLPFHFHSNRFAARERQVARDFVSGRWWRMRSAPRSALAALDDNCQVGTSGGRRHQRVVQTLGLYGTIGCEKDSRRRFWPTSSSEIGGGWCGCVDRNDCLNAAVMMLQWS